MRIIYLSTLVILLCWTSWGFVAAEPANTPTVSPNRLCDLDKAAGSGLVITNTSSTTSGTAFTIFYNEAHIFQTLTQPTIDPGESITYQPLPSPLAANFKGWALVSQSAGSFVASPLGVGINHAADFEITVVADNTQITILNPDIVGDNCYDSFAVSWGDGTPEESFDKGETGIFHFYPYVTGTHTYSVTLTTQLGSSAIVSHTHPIEIAIVPTAIALHTQGQANLVSWAILGFTAVLLLTTVYLRSSPKRLKHRTR